MRFETCEPRVVFDQSLGALVAFELETTTDNSQAEQTIPSDIQFRDTSDDFEYFGDSVDANTLDNFIAATADWSGDPEPVYTFELDDNEVWRKLIAHNPPSVHEDGYIVAERIEGQPDKHTMLLIQRPESDSHTHNGIYTLPNQHYRYSFDVRHPESELSWLTTKDSHWSLVTQYWGPGSAGGGAGLNPPFSIHTSVRNGVPYWVVSSRGDANEITTRPFDEERLQHVPMENIGEWHTWDIEYVPSYEGAGIARAWLNGELIVDWVDVSTSFLGYVDGEVSGPINPLIGLYSYDVADAQEAHFDNITFENFGLHESSISGVISNTQERIGNTVYATNQETGLRYGDKTNRSGIYTLALPRGEYTVTAVDDVTGEQSFVENISTLEVSSVVVDLDVAPPSPPPLSELLTLTGDVTGDGKANIITRLSDGTWQVSSVDSTGNATSSAWTNWSTNVSWQNIMLADVNGDDKQDIVGRADNGSWWVAKSTGTSFVNENWAKWTPSIDWLSVSIGDFNGDGQDDIIGRAATNGSWWIAESTGTGFRNSSWGRWTTNVDWEVHVGDFNGDGLSDIAGRANTDGTWWVGASNGSNFQNSYWGKFTSSVGWSEFQVGDFNGDGRDDLVTRADTDGTWWVASSAGDHFQNHHYGSWMQSISWGDVQITDVNGDGLSDIVGRALTDNSWWIAKSNGNEFQNQYWGATWEKSVDWVVAVADDFDGDGAADLLGANTGENDNWWLGQ